MKNKILEKQTFATERPREQAKKAPSSKNDFLKGPNYGIVWVPFVGNRAATFQSRTGLKMWSKVCFSTPLDKQKLATE